jgi:diaminohydroxyphosphoribosylaminopyrimidine deaminase/5-amino-6-(5-phosphoribosylamino)uracil reductase
LGHTGTNPAVGALIVQRDSAGPRIIGRGWTAIGGAPHAETEALLEAGDSARGATAYVTLEPCAHQGKTPPCADALAASGIARLVTPMTDPDSRVAGRGLAILKAAGIEVTNGVLESEAKIALGGHIRRVTDNRPWITLKLAISADGMIGRREGDRVLVSGPEATNFVQALRTEYDSIMVGIGTVEADDPRLTSRSAIRITSQAVRVVLDPAARISLGSNLVRSARVAPVWLIVSDSADSDRLARLHAAGVITKKVGMGSTGLVLDEVFARLAEDGRCRVLVEGGAKLAAGLVAGDFVDEAVFIRAPSVIGPEGVPALAGQSLSAVDRSPRYRLIDDAFVGEDRVKRYVRIR